LTRSVVFLVIIIMSLTWSYDLTALLVSCY